MLIWRSGSSRRRSVPTRADPGHVAAPGNAEPAKQMGGAEPGELQQLRRAVDPAGNDDLAARPCCLRPTRRVVFDADRAAALEQDAGGVRVRRNGQVLAA